MKRWNDIPLRMRLAVLYVALFSGLLLVITGVSYLSMRHFLISGVTSRLSAQARTAIGQWEKTTSGPLTGPPSPPLPPPHAAPPGDDSIAGAEELARSLATGDAVALVMDRQGRVVATGGGLPDGLENATYPCYSRALAEGREASCVLKLNGERYLALMVPLEKAPGEEIVGVVQLTTSLRSVDRVIERQGLLSGIGLGVLILLGMVLGVWTTSSALRPLDEMVGTCHRIADGDLSQRVNLPQRGDEIGQLARAFDEMVSRIESTFEAQERFVANAAHELRTPLTALQGSLEVLMRGALDDPSTAHRLAQNMYREVTRLSRLCDRLLDLTRLKAPESIHKKSVGLRQFFDEFVQQAGFLARERHLLIRQGPDATTSFDPEALKRALFDLIDNAVQHTVEGGTIEVGWDVSQGELRIFVRDDGEGILPQDLPHVFEPFYRGDRSRSRRQGGTGLGLTIVKSLVEAHGGRIEAVSEPGHGAEFIIDLPGLRDLEGLEGKRKKELS